MPKGRHLARNFHAAKLLASTICLSLCGCEPPTTTRSALDAMIETSTHNTFPSTLFYTGSGAQFDFYVIENGFDKSQKRYRIAAISNIQPARIPVTSDPRLWREITLHSATQSN